MQVGRQRDRYALPLGHRRKGEIQPSSEVSNVIGRHVKKKMQPSNADSNAMGREVKVKHNHLM